MSTCLLKTVDVLLRLTENKIVNQIQCFAAGTGLIWKTGARIRKKGKQWYNYVGYQLNGHEMALIIKKFLVFKVDRHFENGDFPLCCLHIHREILVKLHRTTKLSVKDRKVQKTLQGTAKQFWRYKINLISKYKKNQREISSGTEFGIVHFCFFSHGKLARSNAF